MEDKKIFLGGLEIKNDIIKPYLCNSYEKDGKSFIRDTYNFENNIITKRLGKNLLTGNEKWRYDPETKTYAYYQENKFNENGLGKFDTMLCTHFRWQEYSSEIPESMFQGNDKGEIMFNFYDATKGLDYFKNWLKEQYNKNKPVEVLFALQFPIIIKKEKIYNWNYLDKLNREFQYISVTSENGLDPIVSHNIDRNFNRML